MLSKVFVLCFMLKLISGLDGDQYYCYENSTSKSDLYKQFATKTSYEAVKGTDQDQYKVTSCTPAKVWLLSRHGAIYPTTSTFDDLFALTELKETIKGHENKTLCVEDVQLLEGWALDTTKKDSSGKLTEEGMNEVKTLAVDYKNAFADYEELRAVENVLFRRTPENRLVDSVLKFASELFGSTNDINVSVDDYDRLLKFYEHSDVWKANKDKVNGPDSIPSKFAESKLFKDVIKGISDRLGFPESDQLTAENVKRMWDMCRYDKAWLNPTHSPWCSAFTKEQVNVLEYYEDIKLYFMTGHGNEVNSRLACHTMADLLHHFQDESTSSPKAIISFADAEAIQLFVTALGSHNDTTVPSSSLDDLDNVKNRKWKSSEISPFASNIAVVKYDCEIDDKDSKVVKLFLNHNPLILEWCTDDKCNFDDFIEKFASKENCSGTSKVLCGAIILALNLILIYFF